MCTCFEVCYGHNYFLICCKEVLNTYTALSMKLFVFNVLMGSVNFLCFLLTPVLMFFLSLLLSLSMLHQVHQFSNKQTEMALRVASLDYLGTVAARLRKDAVTSKMDQRSIDRILQQVEEQLHI